MKLVIKLVIFTFLLMTISSCGKEGEAVAPGNGSALRSIQANCGSSSCI